MSDALCVECQQPVTHDDDDLCQACGLRCGERCPVCRGVAELTPSGFLTCREHGSDHYRVRR